MKLKTVDLTGYEARSDPIEKNCYKIIRPNGDIEYFSKPVLRESTPPSTEIPSEWTIGFRIASNAPYKKRQDMIEWWVNNIDDKYKKSLNKKYCDLLERGWLMVDEIKGVYKWMMNHADAVKSPNLTIKNLLSKNAKTFKEKMGIR